MHRLHVKKVMTLFKCRSRVSPSAIMLSHKFTLFTHGGCHKSLKTNKNRCSELTLKNVAMKEIFFAMKFFFFCCDIENIAIRLVDVQGRRGAVPPLLVPCAPTVQRGPALFLGIGLLRQDVQKRSSGLSFFVAA